MSETKETTLATEAPAARQAGHPSEPIERDKLYIGGEWVTPAGMGTIEVTDAATEEVIAHIPEGSSEDIDRAVAAARPAFDAWSQAPLERRLDACEAYR